MQNNHIIIDEEHHGKKITNYLKQKILYIKNAQIYKIIRTGEVRINGARIKNQFRLQKGQILRIPPNLIDKVKKQNAQKLPDNINDIVKNFIIFEDQYLMVINKPYDIASQGGKNNRDNIDAWLTQYSENIKQPRPLLVHRLDKVTTGVLILAKNSQISSQIAQQLKNKTITKKYLAIINNTIKPKNGTINQFINKKQNDQIIKQNAITKYQTIDKMNFENEQYSLVSLQPETGRKHQIRIHLASKNCPVLGDIKYYQNKKIGKIKKQFIYLHARNIKIKHPYSDASLEFNASLPKHFEDMIEKMGWRQKLTQFERN